MHFFWHRRSFILTVEWKWEEILINNKRPEVFLDHFKIVLVLAKVVIKNGGIHGIAVKNISDDPFDQLVEVFRNLVANNVLK